MLQPQPSLPQKSEVSLEVDAEHALVRIHFRGVVTNTSIHGHAERVRDLVAKLGPGFTLVTDLTGLTEMELDTVGEITRVMDFCLHAGVKRIVRVIPDPSKDIGFHLLSMTHYRGRVPIVICGSAAEAEQILRAP